MDNQKLPESSLSTISRRGTQSSNSVREYSDPIQVDLLIDIFSRVDAKSIARFRCVSKFWESILRRPDFTELFLTTSFTRPRLLFVFAPCNRHDLIFYSSPQPQNPDDNTSVVATRYHTCFAYNCSTTLCGLVLLSRMVLLGKGLSRREEWLIYNPVTRESVTLPRLKRKITRDSMEQYYKFGYDPISKQFKVLCMTSSDHVTPSNHLVLTLEAGKPLWRRIEKFHYKWDHYISGSEKCINGVMYFGGVVQESSVIVCFDVRYEKFGFINIDEDMLLSASYGGVHLTLINYKGKLGVYQYQTTKMFPNQNKLVLWSLEDAGKHKWSKHIYELSPQGKEIVTGNYNFVGMTSTSEIVFASFHSSSPYYLFFYNLERNTFARVAVHGFEESDIRSGHPNTSLDYVETMKFT